MPGSMPQGMWGVWVQPITNDTAQANIEKYGEVVDLYDIIDSGDSVLSCGGATSPTGPRYSDDQMGMLWFYSKSAADYASGELRQDIIRRNTTGALRLSQLPNWYTNVYKSVFAAVPAMRDTMRLGLNIDPEVTDSQLDNALELYIIETGDESPTLAAFGRWLARHRDWVSPLPNVE